MELPHPTDQVLRAVTREGVEQREGTATDAGLVVLRG